MKTNRRCKGIGGFRLSKNLFAAKKLRRISATNGGKKSNLSFPAACTSEMTSLMTGAAERPSCNHLVKKAQRAFFTVSKRLCPCIGVLIFFFCRGARLLPRPSSCPYRFVSASFVSEPGPVPGSVYYYNYILRNFVNRNCIFVKHYFKSLSAFQIFVLQGSVAGLIPGRVPAVTHGGKLGVRF